MSVAVLPVFMKAFGKVTDVMKEFEWKIENFFTLQGKKGKSYCSPFFIFLNEYWYLTIYPNGQIERKSVGYIGLSLNRYECGPPVSIAFSLGLKSSDGSKKHLKTSYFHEFEEPYEWGCFDLVERSTIVENKIEMVPSNVLTVVCIMEDYTKLTSHSGGLLMGDTKKCSHCKKVFRVADISSHECLKRPIRCPSCKDVLELKKWFDHECEIAKVKASIKLNCDLKNIFENKEHSDVTIKVKDEEFSLHRNILAGRNLYFNSMFNTEMKEKTTGIVTIDDCEPGIFRSFIHFVYTGKVDEISLENVCDLYKMVDKYQEDQLKEECLCFMKAKMSVESFCDFIVLALKHDEKELLKNATDLFCRKTKEIIQSVNWQTFMREYPTEANELYLKAYNYKPK